MMNDEKICNGGVDGMIKERWDQGHFYSVLPEMKNDTLRKIANSKEIFTNIDYNDQSHEEILNTL